jgi:hypothetical protein
MLKTICDDLTTCCGETPVLDFTELGDVPHSYVGEGGKVVRVNAGETGLEFFTLTLVTTFLGLSDTPGTYAGSGLFFVRVNAGETALEFFDLTATLVTTFLGLSDTPGSYAGAALQTVRVNAGETALEFFTQEFILLGDVPNSYSGAAGKLLAVNPGETALEFSTQTVTDLDFVLQPRLIGLWGPTIAAASGLFGFAAQVLDSSTAGQIQISSNLLLRSYHIRYSSVAATNRGAGIASSVAVFVRGNGSNEGGFRMRMRMGQDQTPGAHWRAFVGVSASFAINIDPSAKVDCAGFGYDDGDTVWSFFNNDASGTATKASLGANFPIDATSLYQIEITCLPSASRIDWAIKNLSTGNSTSGFVTTNLPTATTALFAGFIAGTGTGSAAASICHVCSSYEVGANS